DAFLTPFGGHLRRRRLQLKLHQWQAAQKLNVSTVTLSRWECDKVIRLGLTNLPSLSTWAPFANPALGRPKGNETPGVALLSSAPSADISQQIMKRRLELKKTRKQMAKEMGISVKTLWGWETKRHKLSALLQDRIHQSFGFHPRQR